VKIERVLADNAGPFTGPGTNTWLLDDGSGSVVIIDPGPVDPHHAEAITVRIGGRTPHSVLVTHTHIDHAPLANPLARELDVPALGYAKGPEFDPDLLLSESASWEVGSLDITVIHTPGHANDHLCFRVGNVLFTGDHIMGGSSVMVEAMGPYLRSLEKLRDTGLERLYPGHGEEMGQPDQVIDWYLAHRRQRHGEILEAIRDGAVSSREVVETVYVDVDRSLHPLAERSVRAHLGLLVEEGLIAWDGGNITILPADSQ
jgi:glyoxylase-like metal-dependent hydrolase (beta-lactamase superfamily II)